jgi:tetratricopeptide (TPR) repeat protein/CHAT domain-containing protein
VSQRAALAAVLLTSALWAPPAPAQAPGIDDAAVRTLAEQYVATQEREDAAAYLALWSPASPSVDQMRRISQFAFRNTDYRLSNVEIDRIEVAGDRARVRIIADREVIDSRDTKPDGSRIVRMFRSLMAVVLTCVKEEGVWRVWEETNAIRTLADALADATADEARERLLESNPRLVSADLRAMLAQRVDQLYVMQNFDVALSLLRLVERVAIEAGDRAGLASAYHNTANILYFKQQFAESVELYRRRLAIEEDLGNRDGQADAWRGLATVQYSQGDYVTALASYQRALAIRETGTDETAVADLRVGVGNVRFLLGDYGPALEAYERAREVYERRFGTLQMGVRGQARFGLAPLTRVLQGIGRVRTAQGDYGAALEAHGRALDLAMRAEDKAAEVNGRTSLADVRYRQGRYEAAVQLYRGAADLAKSLGDMDAMAAALSGAGLAELVRGRPGPAADAYKQAVAAYEGLRDQGGLGRALVGLGYAQSDLDQHADAVASYDRALALFTARRLQEDTGRALIGRAMARARLGEHERELADAEASAAIAVAIANADLTWRAATRVGLANASLEREAPARAAFESAVTTIERVRAEVGGDVEPSFLDDRAAPYLGMVDLLAAAGDAAGALSYAERARAQVRWDLLRRGPGAIDRGMSDADRDEERALVHDIVSLRTQVSKMRELPKPDPASLARLEADLAVARERHGAFERRLQESLPSLARWRGRSAPVDAAAALTLVTEAGTAAVEFVVTDERVHLFVLAQGRLTHYAQAITRKDLATRLSLGLDPAALGSRDAWLGPSRDLSDLLLAPAREELAGARLVVLSPDAVLWRVPFEALDAPAPPSATPEAASARPALIEQAAVAYVTSLTTWMYAREATESRQGTAGEPLELLAFGDEATADELSAVAAAYGPGRSAVHFADAASEAHARAESAFYPVVHIASAGTIDNASPLYSFVRLGSAQAEPGAAYAAELKFGPTTAPKIAPATDSATPTGGVPSWPRDSRAEGENSTPPEDDGVLHAWEVLGLAARADLVVCSALEWPAGTQAGAEGVTGLSWAWLAAGTPAAVISRWPVPAPGRQGLLGAFHRHLRDETSVLPASRAQALRAAILETLREPATSAPLHWAGFMMVGDPK